MTNFPRSSGLQLHLTSLPGGRLGAEAFKFVDWLQAAGQSWWQMLPLAPPDRHRSPYKASSAFAAWKGLLGEPKAPVSRSEAMDFREREAFWIEDWIRFGGSLADQVRFDREWQALRRYASERGVSLFGDVAIYVAPGSVDHKAHPSLFQSGAVAGAPPDAFSDLGQLWGNPLYDWTELRRTGYEWWVQRLSRTLRLFEAVRLDHFRGFVSYWAVPEDAPDARGGEWRRGPGRRLFDAFRSSLGGALPLVAEDLGVITPAVSALRDGLQLPGMVVLQFGFEEGAERESPHYFGNHRKRSWAYIGTHDHDTARGFYESTDEGTRDRVDALCAAQGIADQESWWRLVRLCLKSPAQVAVLQAQDVLGLGSEARTNDPGRPSGNWRWQMEPGALTADMAKRLREVTEETGRLQGGSGPSAG